MLKITTECGHKYENDTDLTASDVSGMTTNCKVCGSMLIFLGLDAFASDFHKHLASTNPDWPADGANTGFIEVAATK